MSIFEKILEHLNPAPNPDIERAFEHQTTSVPTLWLLGKTGAGKSSLIQTVTGNDDVVVGNGFQPCTQTAASYLFPEEKPLLRFLDTRGLAEADYDPTEDIDTCIASSHALIVVMKAQEVEQSHVLKALEQIARTGKIKELLLVQTGVDQLSEPDRQSCVLHQRDQVKQIWPSEFVTVEVDFELKNGEQFGIDELIGELANLMPVVAHIADRSDHKTKEEENFSLLRNEVLFYAGTAATSDVIPGVGLVSVPVIQGKMLHSLGNQYGIEWNRTSFTEFVGALGAGFGVQYVSRLGIRQLIKLIPAYGQTIGAASAAAMSFASTYAIGRAACMYLYHKSREEEINPEQLRQLYKEALKRGKEVAHRD